MNRRNFVRNAALAGAALPLKDSLMENAAASRQQWYELRTYTFADDAQRGLTTDYLEKSLVPALNRAGIHSVGVFNETQPEMGQPKTILLVPFGSVEAFTTINEKLTKDSTYWQSAAPYLDAPAATPAYQRIESSLLKAFAHMPQLEAPAQKNRIFELRRYESPSEAAGQKKIEMFNDAGEIDIFKKVGARPVFFGETIIGQYRPNLTYMLTFDDMPAHDAVWKAFGSDPDWKAVSKKPEYSDARLISKITRRFLAPAPFSQI
jgi:hypothetical protein